MKRKATSAKNVPKKHEAANILFWKLLAFQWKKNRLENIHSLRQSINLDCLHLEQRRPTLAPK